VVAELDALGLLATPARPCPRELAYEDVGKLSFLTNCIKARCNCRTRVPAERGLCTRLRLDKTRPVTTPAQAPALSCCTPPLPRETAYHTALPTPQPKPPSTRGPGVAAAAPAGQWDHAYASARSAPGALHAPRGHADQHQPGRHGEQRAQLRVARPLPPGRACQVFMVLVPVARTVRQQVGYWRSCSDGQTGMSAVCWQRPTKY